MTPPFLTSSLDTVVWAHSWTCHITIGETSSGTNCIGSWVGPRAGLDIMDKRKSFVPAGNLTPTPPSERP
jgi:hypothetical protein